MGNFINFNGVILIINIMLKVFKAHINGYGTKMQHNKF